LSSFDENNRTVEGIEMKMGDIGDNLGKYWSF
jgi:hypothetical protein